MQLHEYYSINTIELLCQYIRMRVSYIECEDAIDMKLNEVYGITSGSVQLMMTLTQYQ